MSKKPERSNRRSSSGSSPSAQPGPGWNRPAAWLMVVLFLAAAGAFGLTFMEGRVLSGRTGGQPSRLEVGLRSPPAWMPESLVSRIAAAVLPPGARYYDPELAEKVRRVAQMHPWIKRVVRVEKYPTDNPSVAAVDIEAVFRMPVAKVRAERGLAYVDAEGYRLPAEQVPLWAEARCAEDGRRRYYLDPQGAAAGTELSAVHYMMIEGVAAPAPAVGEKWPGEDIAAGLKLVELVSNRPYAYQITAVDVSNFGGRLDPAEPHLRMWAQVGRLRPTCIKFGRLPRPDGDYVVSPRRKLSYLDQYAADHDGQLAGLCRYIDLRYDHLHVSIN